MRYPTAEHAPADRHVTADRALSSAPAGLAVGWTDQELPSHASASVRGTLLAWYPPTAVQDVADGHDTPARKAPWLPAGAGACWSDHEVPSQRSARGDVLNGLFRQAPTA